MRVKAVKTEWFQDYKLPSLYIAFPNCTFKCEKECGEKMCQNSHLATLDTIDIDTKTIIESYINNPITKAIVCGGLEPLDSFSELLYLIWDLRHNYKCQDDIVIYTGYKEEEIPDVLFYLKEFENIIIKFGRYMPNQTPHFDEVLGVKLASDNQYAKYVHDIE